MRTRLHPRGPDGSQDPAIARAILADIPSHGGEQSLVVRWAKLRLEREAREVAERREKRERGQIRLPLTGEAA